MKILVTGSSGLIGSALCRHLTEDGRHVVRLVRDPRPRTTDGTGLVTDVPWDPSRGIIDLDGLEAAGPLDGVVHLAGAGIGDRRWSPRRKQIIVDSRTGSTRLLVTSLLQLAPRPPVLVSASAVGYYGDRGGEELTEESSPGSGFLADLCDAWERATAPAAAAGIRTVNLRTGLVLSAAGGALAKLLPLFRLGLGGRLGPGTQYQSWITLDDHVGVIIRALADGGIDGPVNVTTPTPVTNAELSAAIARALHRPSLVAVPRTALRLVLGAEMADELLLSGQRAVPAKLMAAAHGFAHPEIEGALRSVLAQPAG